MNEILVTEFSEVLGGRIIKAHCFVLTGAVWFGVKQQILFMFGLVIGIVFLAQK